MWNDGLFLAVFLPTRSQQTDSWFPWVLGFKGRCLTHGNLDLETFKVYTIYPDSGMPVVKDSWKKSKQCWLEIWKTWNCCTLPWNYQLAPERLGLEDDPASFLGYNLLAGQLCKIRCANGFEILTFCIYIYMYLYIYIIYVFIFISTQMRIPFNDLVITKTV